MTHTAYIGLGSNLNQPQQQIHHALARLDEHPHITLIACSPLYQSRPMGPTDQPNYLNGAALIHTTLTPNQLLAALQEIEHALHRIRGDQRWGPRSIDLDLLLFDALTMVSEHLTIPHPGITERDFVLRPLLDLNAELTLPDGRRVRDCLKNCPDHYLEQLLASGDDCHPDTQALT